MQRIRLWFETIRDSFVILLPLTFIGVLGLLIRDFPLPEYQALMQAVLGNDWQHSAGVLINATQGFFGLTLCLIVSVELGRRISPDLGVPRAFLALSAITNFLLCMSVIEPVHQGGLGMTAVFTGLVISVASTEVFVRLLKRPMLQWRGLAYENDSNFHHALRAAGPMVVSCLLFYALAQLAHYLIGALLALLLQMQGWAMEGLSTVMVISSLFTHLVWFTGLHGGYALDAVTGTLLPVSGALLNGTDWRAVLNHFTLMGGAGATLGLLLAISLVAKAGSLRFIARLSVLPGLFNINETVLYGLPVLLNRRFFLPFVLVPLVLALLSVAAVNMEWLVLDPTVSISWTTPMLISGWMLTHSWHGAAFQLLLLAVSTAIYLPFVRRAQAETLSREREAFAHTIRTIEECSGNDHAPLLPRSDGVGLVARGLLQDFCDDLRADRLRLAFQPKHDLTGRVIGFEALMRWPHLRHGMLSPAVAIALVEESGDIHAFGHWVINEACAAKARWNAAQPDVRGLLLSINVSPIQLERPGLAAVLVAALKRHHLSPHEIELEITETQTLSANPVVMASLAELSATGVHFAIDDFGMGHSSLLYLKRFAVGAIKIDGSITREIISDDTGADIVRAIAALGKARNVLVVAEFVESIEQRNRLAELGCECFQGYLFSPAIAESAVIDYVQRASLD